MVRFSTLCRHAKALCGRLLCRQGLTFIEMLLATTMVMVIAVALYGMLSNGIRVWELVNQETPQIDMNLFFQRLETELKNCIQFRGMEFKGRESSLTFPALIKKGNQVNEFKEAIALVRYFHNPESNTADRQCTDFRQLLSLREPGSRSLVSGVETLLFSYYFFDDEKDTFFWTSIWPPQERKENKGRYPQAVRITMIFRSGEGMEKRIKTINVPIAGLMQ